MNNPQRVAFLGLGIMGSRMAANLARAGFEVVAWNRTRARAEELSEKHGTTVADTPAEAAAATGTVISMGSIPRRSRRCSSGPQELPRDWPWAVS